MANEEGGGEHQNGNGDVIVDGSVESLEALFKRYCQLGQGHGSKKATLNQTQMNKMFMDAGIYKEFPKLDRNVLGIYWSYAFKKEKEIDYKTTMEGWKSVFPDRYNIDSKGEVSKDDFWYRFSKKLSSSSGPKLAATKVDTASVMNRLTDESKYTGMHKQRAETSVSAKKPSPAKSMTATSTTRTASSAKPSVSASSSTKTTTATKPVAVVHHPRAPASKSGATSTPTRPVAAS